MNTFGYYDPTSVQKAAGITADKSDAKYLAGGQSLLAAMKLRTRRAQRPRRSAPGCRSARHQGGRDDGHHRRDDAARGCRCFRRRRLAHQGAGGIGRARSAIARCATAARSAARWPTTTPRPTIRPRLWLSAPPSSPTSARSPPMTSSRACSRRHLKGNEIITGVAFPVPKKAAYQKFKQPGVALRDGRRVRCADRFRCARRRHRRRHPRRLPREGHGGCPRQELVGRCHRLHRRPREGPHPRISTPAPSTART